MTDLPCSSKARTPPFQATPLSSRDDPAAPAPNSFTTEPTLELHLHSSPATLRRVLSAFSRLPGLRPAERGEFTKRAYLAGRINLLQAEGLRDLIDAETEAQRKVAWGSFSVSRLYTPPSHFYWAAR